MQFEQKFCDNLCIKPQDNPKIKPKENVCSDIQGPLDNILANEGYVKYDFKINMVNTEGGNYLGNLYEVDVKGQTKNGLKETNIFVKLMPKEDIFQGIIILSKCYYNESFAYKYIGKIINKVYDKASVPESDRFQMVKYYTESNDHTLFFENLSRKGYIALDRRQVISINYAKSVIKELARFHSITFILKKKNSILFEKNIKTIKSPIFLDRNSAISVNWWKEYFKKAIKLSFDCINKEFEDKKEEIERLIYKVFDMFAIDSTSRFSSVNCMCHGDVKPGNILWKKNNKGEDETVFIDYQLMHYGSPVYDILFFLYMATDRKFRQDHLDYLKDLYHDTMTDNLKYFDLDVNSFYPRHVFEKDFQERLHYGLLIALVNLPFILNEKPDVLVREGSDQAIPLHSSFKKRINEVFQDYVDWGIL